MPDTQKQNNITYYVMQIKSDLMKMMFNERNEKHQAAAHIFIVRESRLLGLPQSVPRRPRRRDKERTEPASSV